MDENQSKPASKFPRKWILLGVLCAAAIIWLRLTPPGLLGKADAIGYAVCHRIDSHSLHIGERQMPLCVRCSGMYLGTMLGLIFQAVQGKKGAYPPLKTIIVMAVLVLAFGIDGSNSYIHFFPGVNGLYEPQTWSRIVTGMGMGLAMAAAVVPAFNQTVWRSWKEASGLANWKQLALLFVLAGLIIIAALSESAWLLYPMALISSAGVLVLLTMIYSMVLVMIFKIENVYERFDQMCMPLMGGALMALLQIGVFDLVRYLWTGTWAGFNL
ncbi:MAG: DUF2085 domain-containing protein [Chloroflexota bacterium]